MRLLYIFLLVAVLVAISCYLCFRWRLGIYGKSVVVVIAVLVWLLGGELINLNTLPYETMVKLKKVVVTCGDTYVKRNGNDIYIKINDKWLNLNKISIIGGVLTDDLYIEYEGKNIYLGHSGVVNTIRALESVGLIDSK